MVNSPLGPEMVARMEGSFVVEAFVPAYLHRLRDGQYVDAETIEVDLKKGGLKAPEFAALNPNMKAPVLVDGDVVLSFADFDHTVDRAAAALRDVWIANGADSLAV